MPVVRELQEGRVESFIIRAARACTRKVFGHPYWQVGNNTHATSDGDSIKLFSMQSLLEKSSFPPGPESLSQDSNVNSSTIQDLLQNLPLGTTT